MTVGVRRVATTEGSATGTRGGAMIGEYLLLEEVPLLFHSQSVSGLVKKYHMLLRCYSCCWCPCLCQITHIYLIKINKYHLVVAIH
jgi:hypothetical protein